MLYSIYNYYCTADSKRAVYNFFVQDFYIIGHLEGFLEGTETWGQTSRGPLEKSRGMSDYVKITNKKIIAQTFRNRGTLVILCPCGISFLFFIEIIKLKSIQY